MTFYTGSRMIQTVCRKTAVVLEMIKFQHSVFALPFAFVGMIVAANGMPRLWTFFWIVAACVFARSAAMAFNRWTDVAFDAENPRTRDRALVTGALDTSFALGFAWICVGGFVLSAAMLNPLCLWLSPVALVILLGYSYTKRFTRYAHFVLGLALAIAPIGAWIAVRGDFRDWPAPVALGVGVLMWTAGFDIIYACQDVDVDRRSGLWSIPQSLGLTRALWMARVAHGLALMGFLAFWRLGALGMASLIGALGVGGLLVAQHWMVRGGDLSRVNVAFFHINSMVGFVYLCGILIDLFVWSAEV